MPSLTRLADFTKRATAAEVAFGWPTLSVYEAMSANRKEIVETGIDAEPVADAIRSFLLKKESWRGTATELLEKLRMHTDDGSLQSRAWPKTPATLGTQLRRISAHLRRIGINIEYDREDQNRRRVIILNRVNSAVHAVQGVQNQQESQLNLDLEPPLLKSSISQQKPHTPGAQPEAPNEKLVLDEGVNSTLDNEDSVDSKVFDDSDDQPF